MSWGLVAGTHAPQPRRRASSAPDDRSARANNILECWRGGNTIFAHLAWQSLQGDIGTKAENNREYQTCGPRPVPGRALAPSMSTARPVPARASSVRCSSRRSSCSSRGKPLSSAVVTMVARRSLSCGALRRRRCKSSPLTRRHRNRDPEHHRHDQGAK